MSKDKAWDDSEVFSAEYAHEFTMDLSGDLGLNASDAHDPSTWLCAWHVGADSIFRYYKDGKLLRVKMPEHGLLSMALLAELAGIEIIADDVVSMTYDTDSGAIEVAVNNRLVVIGERSSDGGCEWWAEPSRQTHTDQGS